MAVSAREESGAEIARKLRLLRMPPEDFAAPLADARLALRRIEGRLAHDYAAARAQARDAKADLNTFKEEQGLRRAALYPDSRVLQAGLLLAAAVFESLFSAALFAETDDRGFLGGAVTAIGLSGANVVLGFLAGFLGLRYMQHIRRFQKIAGALGFAFASALALFLNFFAAMWRQRLIDPAEPLPADAGGFGARIGEFFNASFSLSEPQAIVLLMLGGGVWVFATLKGYSGFDDPYPDYGKLARASADADDALADLRSDARDELEAPIESARAAIQERLDAQRKALAAMNAAYDEAAAKQAGEDALVDAGALIMEARETLARTQAEAAKSLEALIADLEAAQARLDAAGAA